MDVASEFARGYVAGAAGICVGYPFESVKTLMQNNRQHTSFLREMTAVVRQRGLLALYDGVASPVTSYGFLIAINFTVYANVARRLEKRYQPSSDAARSGLHGVAGLVSGGALSVVSTPFEMIKLRLQAAAKQVDNRPAHYSSTFACARHVLRTEGLVNGLFKGSSLPVSALHSSRLFFF
jgi:solute carrier family 25 carnitine/acylcarnitine transporter 20/29